MATRFKPEQVRRGRLSPDARRRELLDAAVRVLRERGPEHCRVEDITAAAGTAKGSFSRYFPTWDDLLLAVRDHLRDQYAEEVVARFEARATVDWWRALGVLFFPVLHGAADEIAAGKESATIRAAAREIIAADPRAEGWCAVSDSKREEKLLEKKRRAGRHPDRPGERCDAPAGTWTPIVDHSRCEAKHDCVDVCPNDVFEVRRIDDADYAALGLFGKLRVSAHKRQTAYTPRADDCRACGLCVVACPEKAITLVPPVSA